ncbi:hypothetical protein [Sphingomonas colocasiae]|uniref:DUF3137 domain-containing protein n=1 Tax=Sphingomonas colocasiae TaxID=1848973 RepID=A0ABS7PUE0_9SPHN|nr:hypothetical protein [Sphingomonas colocasiae]MBY8824982.1 hypothetical protein [Sphingomonas colocasiae]
MRNGGVRHPERNTIICGVIALGGIVAVAFGAYEMQTLGHETGRSAASISLGLLAAILGTALFANFLWAVRIVRAMRSGRTAIARWTVPADQVERYREIDARFAEREAENDYRLPRAIPADGLEVIFSEDGVLIGDCYFGLATTGMTRFQRVASIASDPPMIEFGTAMTVARNPGRFSLQTVRGTLRVPVSREAAQQADRVVRQYLDVIERRVIVKPHFWTVRIRGGLIVLVVCALLALTGFALADRNQELGNIPLFLAVAGTIFAIGGAIMALLAWALRRRQMEG